jgi:Rhomboid-like protein
MGMTRNARDRFVLALGQAATRRDALQAVFGRFRKLRMTPVYAALVVLVWAVVLAVSPQVRHEIVHLNSTNVANLLHGRVYTLLSSALVLGGRSHVLAVLGLIVVLGIGELAWGGIRVAGVFLFGHVVATLLVFAGLATGIALGQLRTRLATAPDVGISYGTVAVLGALLIYLPLRRRLRWQVLAVTGGVAGVLFSHTFTAVGHLTALLLGFVAGYALRRGLMRRLGRPLVAATQAMHRSEPSLAPATGRRTYAADAPVGPQDQHNSPEHAGLRAHKPSDSSEVAMIKDPRTG